MDSNKNDCYRPTSVSQPIIINAVWEKEPWDNITALALGHYMGNLPENKPKVQAKAAYDAKNIYIIFRVKHEYLGCSRTEYQSEVYKDSCVEFFFTPGPDISEGYFNLETNCIGTALFSFHNTRKSEAIKIPKSDFNKIELAHSITSIVDPEVKAPVTWVIEYRIPFSMLGKYFDIAHPAQGIEWKANFYKIADESSAPHWLAWSKVDFPKPDFHRPEFFGTLQF